MLKWFFFTIQVSDPSESNSCQVNGLARHGDNGVFSVGIDDCLKKVDGLVVHADNKVKLSSQPKAVFNDSSLTYIATVNSVAVVKDNAIIHEEKVEYEPACVAVSTNNKHVIVGKSREKKRKLNKV